MNTAFAIILILPALVSAQHSLGCASAELNLSIDATVAERNDRINRLSAAYTVKPEDNLDLKINAFVGHLSHQGLYIPAELAAQIAGREKGFPVEFPASWSTKTAAVAPVPFAFQRLHDADISAAASTRDLVEHVRHSILNARAGLSRLLGAPAILELQGMSDAFVRHFLNNLASAPGTQYLEVGSWRGSTFTSALFGNEPTVELAVAVDVWEEDRSAYPGNEGILGSVLGAGSHSKAVCIETVNRYTNAGFLGEQAFLIQADFRDFAAMPINSAQSNYNVYMFDGPHAEQDQFDGLSLMLPKLAKVFVFLVDDFNGKEVQLGTLRALQAHGLTVHFAEVLGGGRPDGVYGTWHNGFFAAVLEQV